MGLLSDALSPGVLIRIPIEEQKTPREFIVDDRQPRHSGTVPLLGEKGGEYHLELNGDQSFLRFYSRSRRNWITVECVSTSDLKIE